MAAPTITDVTVNASGNVVVTWSENIQLYSILELGDFNIEVGGNQNIPLDESWSIRSAYHSYTFDSSGVNAGPRALKLSSTDDHIYMGNNDTDNIQHFSLDSPADISTDPLFVGEFDFDTDDTGESALRGLTLSYDGMHTFFVGNVTRRMYRFDNPSAFVIDGATFVSGQQLDVFSVDTKPQGCDISQDGHTVLLAGLAGGAVYGITLSTAYDLGSALLNPLDIAKLTLSAVTPTFPLGYKIRGLILSLDGHTLLLCGNSPAVLHQFYLAEPFNVDSAVDGWLEINISSIDSTAQDVAISSDTNTVFFIGNEHESLYQIDCIELAGIFAKVCILSPTTKIRHDDTVNSVAYTKDAGIANSIKNDGQEPAEDQYIVVITNDSKVGIINSPVMTNVYATVLGDIEILWHQDVGASSVEGEDFTFLVDLSPGFNAIDSYSFNAEGTLLTLEMHIKVVLGQNITQFTYTKISGVNNDSIVNKDIPPIPADDQNFGDVTNGSDVVAPLITSVSVNGDGDIVILYDVSISTSMVEETDFSVKVVGVLVDMLLVTHTLIVSTLTLLLDTKIIYGQTVTEFDYHSHYGQPDSIVDNFSRAAQDQRFLSVPNGSNIISPSMYMVEVNSDGDIVITYDMDISTSNVEVGDYEVLSDLVDLDISGAGFILLAATVTLELVIKIEVGESITEFTYSRYAGQPDSIVDGEDDPALSQLVQSVGNNSKVTTPVMDLVIVSESGDLVITYNTNISDSAIEVTDYTILVNGNNFDISSAGYSVELDNLKITLTLTNKIIITDVVGDFSYLQDDGNANSIVSLNAVPAEDQNIAVTNNSLLTAPELSSVVVNADGDLTLTYNQSVADSNIEVADYTVQVDDADFDLTTAGFTLTVDVVVLLLIVKIGDLRVVTDLLYTRDNGQADSIVNDNGNPAEDQTVDTVTNNSDIVLPLMVSAEISALSDLVITYNIDISDSSLEPADYGILVGGSALDLNAASISLGVDNITLTLVPVIKILLGETVSDLTYNQQSGTVDSIINLDANPALSQSLSAITNDSEVVVPLISLVSVSIGGDLVITYNTNIINSSPEEADYGVRVDNFVVDLSSSVASIGADNVTLLLSMEIKIMKNTVVSDFTYLRVGGGATDNSIINLVGFPAQDQTFPSLFNNSLVVPPTITVVLVNSDGDIVITYDQDISASSVEVLDYSTTVDGEDIDLSSSVASTPTTSITLTLIEKILEGQTVSIFIYERLGGDTINSIVSVTGNHALDQTITSIDNDSIIVPPEIEVVVVDVSGDIIVEYDEAIEGSAIELADYSVLVNEVSFDMADAEWSVSDTILKITLSNKIYRGRVVENFSYSKAGGDTPNSVVDSQGIPAIDQVIATATNNSQVVPEAGDSARTVAVPFENRVVNVL